MKKFSDLFKRKEPEDRQSSVHTDLKRKLSASPAIPIVSDDVEPHGRSAPHEAPPETKSRLSETDPTSRK